MSDSFRKSQAVKGKDIAWIKQRTKTDEDGCWRWQNKLSKTGAGSVAFGNVRLTAHEAAYRIAGNEVPYESRVFQVCGKLDCVNPEHLALKDIAGRRTHDPNYIMENIKKDPETRCWNWQGKLNANGYGRVAVGRGGVLMHRASWEVFRDEIPQDLYVLHKCDNRRCVNPAHLFLGSIADNNIDAREKMRAYTDGRHYNAKLTVDEVLEIKNMPNAPMQDLANLYDVSLWTIKSIRQGNRWSHIT